MNLHIVIIIFDIVKPGQKKPFGRPRCRQKDN